MNLQLLKLAFIYLEMNLLHLRKIAEILPMQNIRLCAQTTGYTRIKATNLRQELFVALILLHSVYLSIIRTICN